MGRRRKAQKTKLQPQPCGKQTYQGHRGVPILIPEVAKAGIAYIASSQVKESVGINSRYLFATVGSEFRLYECLAEHCEKADLSHPQRITATALRKYMATITQALDLKPHQIEWVMRHMGHSLDVHKIYYRSTSDIIERTQLYAELSSLFERWPDLLDDFSGFLLPEQASVCGCSNSYGEFLKARSFLRKLEVCFSKAPTQFQKLMKIFSRWYRKSSRHLADLRDQVEPMLKGQTMILEEFSRFFPDAQPPESLMDDFEDVNMAGSGDDDVDVTTRRDDGFEEVELPDEPEILGTKRCPCQCHDSKDDTYMKRKKHCYQCCLTVMDGELVYKINNKTIKKVNVRFGPPVTPADLSGDKEEPTPGDGDAPGLITTQDRKPDTDLVQQATVNMEPADTDWLTDSETAEKENIEHYGEESSHSQESGETNALHNGRKSGQSRMEPRQYSWKKSSFFQRIGRLSRTSKHRGKNIRLSAVLKTTGKGPQSSPQGNNDAKSMPDQSPTKSSDITIDNIETGNVTETEKPARDNEDSVCVTTRREHELELFGSPSSSPGTGSECSTASDSDKTSSDTLTDSSGDEITADNAWSVGSESPVDGETHVMEIADSDMKSLSSEGKETETIDKDKHLEKADENAPTDSGALATDSVNVENITKGTDSAVQHRSAVAASSDSNLANAILAKAFNSIRRAEISTDSTSLSEAPSIVSTSNVDVCVTKDVEIISGYEPLSTQKDQENTRKNIQTKSVTVVSQQDPITGQSAFPISTMSSNDVPTDNTLTFKTSSSTEGCSSLPIIAPERSMEFIVSQNSCFSKVSSKTKISGDESKGLPFTSDSYSVAEETDSLSTIKYGVDSKSSKCDSSVSNISATDKAEMQKPLAPASPFSPFSQFGQEIQNITAGKSPLSYSVQSADSGIACRRQSTAKLRRITPIPVKKDSSLQSDAQSLSAFELVAKNSPVLFEAPVVNVTSEKCAISFENFNLQLDDSKSNSSVCLKSVRTPTPTSNETPGSGSNSLKSSETNMSQKSDGLVSSGSQQSDKSVTEPISVSQPIDFSEDANEGFIKPQNAITSSGMQSSHLMSDESLIGHFQHAGEELNSISNLTNLLIGLDNHVKFANQTEGSQLHNQSVSVNRSEKEESAQSWQPNKNYVPQSSASIENQARLENLDIKVSSLSDSDSNSKDKTGANEIASKSQRKDSPCFMRQLMVSVKLSDISIESSSLLEHPGCTSDTIGDHISNANTVDVAATEETCEIKADKKDTPPLYKKTVVDSNESPVCGKSATSSKGDLKSKRQKHNKSQNKLDRKSVYKDNQSNTSHSNDLPVEDKSVELVPKTKKASKSLEAVVQRIRSSTTVSAKLDDVSSMQICEPYGNSAQQCSSPTPDDVKQNSNEKHDSCRTKIVKVCKGRVELSPKKKPVHKHTKTSNKMPNEKGTKQNKKHSGTRNKATCRDRKSDASEKLQKGNIKHSGVTGVATVQTRKPKKYSDDTCKPSSSKSVDKVGDITAADILSIKSTSETTATVTETIDSEPDVSMVVELPCTGMETESTPVTGSESQQSGTSAPCTGMETESTPVTGSESQQSGTSAPCTGMETESTPVTGSESQQSGTSAKGAVIKGSEDGSSVESSEGAEPHWTMELDKIILEGIKEHGISDATFARIAEEIGNVTQEQVQGRLQYFCREIFPQVISHD